MGVRVIKRCFQTKNEAIADINAEGFWPVSWADPPGESYAPHSHPSDERLYLIEGSLELVDVAAAETYRLEPGDKLILPAGTVHSASTREGAKYIVAVEHLLPLAESAQPAD